MDVHSTLVAFSLMEENIIVEVLAKWHYLLLVVFFSHYGSS
jgi:hypothetical protein